MRYNDHNNRNRELLEQSIRINLYCPNCRRNRTNNVHFDGREYSCEQCRCSFDGCGKLAEYHLPENSNWDLAVTDHEFQEKK